MQYKNDIAWCQRFGLRSVGDLEGRIVSAYEYQRLWGDRCDVAYNLLAQSTSEQREAWQGKWKSLFLYGANDDLSLLYFEDARGNLFCFPR